jgi:4-hydroxy-3-methylbut-2-en-1-yl diphosphate reductase
MKLILAKPRGFCAGVVRAIEIVERALQRFGAPIYVKHEIVHNQHVIQELKEKGALFIEDLEDVPKGSYLIYSAHGVDPEIRRLAKEKKLIEIDATCPLVTRNHSAVKRFAKMGGHILLIGHKKHVEVVATAEEAKNSVTILESVEEVSSLSFPPSQKLFYLTQTTLGLQESHEIILAIQKKFPLIQTHPETSICYATSNRQRAFQILLQKADFALVIGDAKSSNSNRLKEMALKRGVGCQLINDPDDLHENWFVNVSLLAMTSGASTPEKIVQQCVEKLYTMGLSSVEEISFREERVAFSLPSLFSQ